LRIFIDYLDKKYAKMVVVEMDGMDTILSRRSIRKYTNKKVENEDYIKLIKAAVSAPSSGNQQPWQFIIIQKRDILEKVMEFHPHARMLRDAQGAILICGDLSKEKHKGYWVLDCSAATQNLLLAAHAIGLGACWLGIYPREERISGMTKLASIPGHIVPFALVSLGYPNEEKEASDRFDESMVHYDIW
jgi:nitroreductase